jgi:hypothetical protein
MDMVISSSRRDVERDIYTSDNELRQFSIHQGVAMFVGFPNHFTAESALQRAAGQAENAENSPYFLCEFSDLCGEGNVTPPFYPLPSIKKQYTKL